MPSQPQSNPLILQLNYFNHLIHNQVSLILCKGEIYSETTYDIVLDTRSFINSNLLYPLTR